MGHNTRPPSPLHSADGRYHSGDNNRSHPVAAPVPEQFTPPMHGRPFMTEIMSQSPFDHYGDPSLYHTAQAPIYYTPPRAMITSMPAHTPPRTIPEDGIQTRNGRALGTPSSPGAITNSTRASESPLNRPRRNLKKKPSKKRGPVVEQPLSIMTKDYKTPVRDMSLWVNRPVEERLAEVERKKGYVSRPMNSFMLYRSAYADRAKQFCKENNHQVVSQVTGASWPLETKEVRDLYEQLAVTERDNHQSAHPNYKFAPNKAAKRSRPDDDSDSDGEWEGSNRSSKRGRQVPSRSASSTPFDERMPTYIHSVPTVNPSGYEYTNPYGPPPLMVGPYGLSGDYYQTTTAPYADQISDIKYQKMVDPFPQYQTTLGIIGMPNTAHHELLTSHPAPTAPSQIDMLDPRLGQGDSDFHFGYYEGDMTMGPDVARTITYEPAQAVTYPPEAYHPGMATLTAEDDFGAGSDFETEFRKLG
ncbi:hypothetical protein PV08_03042 [Exophiala spinifera]|uniref:HMG box domain-containing protein n=1 Tax=Exophiala spinifera TaxID=91928 RepID=A0A0D2BIH7_9EURO|nr:uncharacterized protein PV08_03042 [Exophiala spinifera]KIW18753.1 hypothetical protein PV08_03042 [Exophiala spinifera]